MVGPAGRDRFLEEPASLPHAGSLCVHHRPHGGAAKSLQWSGLPAGSAWPRSGQLNIARPFKAGRKGYVINPVAGSDG